MKILLIFFSTLTFYSSLVSQSNSEKLSKHIEKTLIKHTNDDHFEEDNFYYYIKMGMLFNKKEKSAVVIKFDTLHNLEVFTLINNKWTKTFTKIDGRFTRLYSLEAYIEDFNFDGQKDIGILNGFSNGMSIMTFSLWIADKYNFEEIPKFTEIGNPVIVEETKKIYGFTGCCQGTSFGVTAYKWEGRNLKTACYLDIDNYPNDKSLVVTENEYKKTFRISKYDIYGITKNYSLNWKLVRKRANPLVKKYCSS